MRKFLRRADPWAWPLLFMAVIFALSSMPADKEHHGLLYVLWRKSGHVTGYALLLGLWWRALPTQLPHRRALASAFAITVLYAMTDELHQTFVSGRTGRPLDVGIDAAGALIAVALISRGAVRRRIRA